MPSAIPLPRRAQLTGSRIRDRRLMQGLRQADLAAKAGISASYLNLIEHNRRRIGGKLLVAIARALEVEPATLSEGADATLSEVLHRAAQDMRSRVDPPPEVEMIDALSGRFPGWTGLIVAQHKRTAGLEALVDGLRDRLRHDPVLAESMHEVLSTVAAIRSTADILVREPNLEAPWRARFHRNLHEEAERLSARATAMLAHFENTVPEGSGPSTPLETVEALFEAADHHFPAIEAGGAAAIPQLLAQTAGMTDAATRDLVTRMLEDYARDAARLPLDRMMPAAMAVDFAPDRLLHLGQGDAALVLRRLACLPRESDGSGAPEVGLAICDGAGALLFRRRLAGFAIPRFGAGCPLWPLYGALHRPGQPLAAVLDMPSGAQFQAWAVSQPVAQAGFGAAPVMRATMLLRALAPDTDTPTALPRIAAGPGCHACARSDCPARSMIGPGA